MPFCYDKLWKKLIDYQMNKSDLRKVIGVSPNTIAKMSKNENVNLYTLGSICEYFQCEIGDIIEYKKE